MKNRLMYVAIVLCMLASIVPAALKAPAQALTPTLYVDDDGAQCPFTDNYSTIQAAIDNASNGYTIVVYDGTYNENIVIDKAVYIRSVNGSANTTINGGGVEGAVVDIEVNGVTFGNVSHGFNVTFATTGILYDHMDVSGNVTGTRIVGNTIYDCDYGVQLKQEADSDMYGNTIIGNTIYDCYFNGIVLDNWHFASNIHDNNVSGNTVYNCGWDEGDYGSRDGGIVFINDQTDGDIYDNTVTGNNVSDCSYGITFLNYYYSDESGVKTTGGIYGNTIANNNVSACYLNILFENDQNGVISDNTISANTMDGITMSSYGIRLYANNTYWACNFADNTISDNTIYNIDGFAINLNAGSYSNITGTAIDNNTIHDINYGILLENQYIANIAGSTITDNRIYNCSSDGIQLSLSSGDGGDIYDNTLSGNIIHDFSGCGVRLISEAGPNIWGNTISGNTVYNSSYTIPGAPLGVDSIDSAGICLESTGIADVRDNTVEGNTVHNCTTGIYLYADPRGSATSNNTVEGNTIYSCSTGIKLFTEYDGYMYGNTVESNYIYSCSIGTCQNSEYDGYMSGNDILDNTIEYNEDSAGISLYTRDGGHIDNSTIEGNEVYGNTSGGAGIWLNNRASDTIEDIDIVNNTLFNASAGKSNYYGIRLFECNDINIRDNNLSNNSIAGLYIQGSFNISVIRNTIHNNNEGIYLGAWDSIITGNDIRDNNPADHTGIYIEVGAFNISITCNNIVNNGYGLYYNGDNEIDAPHNWWGDAGGPGANDSNTVWDDEVVYEPWLTEALVFNASSDIVATAAVPGTVALIGDLGDFFDVGYSDRYSMGPYYSDLIVEVPCHDACGAESATVNLSALLFNLLPADFEEKYVSHWNNAYISGWNDDEGAYLSDIWQEWLNYLSNYSMGEPSNIGNESNPVCVFDQYFSIEQLFSYHDEYSLDAIGLRFFFENGYPSEEEGTLNHWTLVTQQLRMGQFEIPVTVHTCYDQLTSDIPLKIVDFQSPLQNGWNVRSSPVALDSNYSSWSDIRDLSGGIPGIEAALTWNDSAARWEELTPSTMFSPLQAYFILVNGNSSINFIMDRDPSRPPTRNLSAGWNLVGPATDYNYNNESLPNDYPFPEMMAQDSLASVANTSDGGTGWLTAVNVNTSLSYRENFYYKGFPLDNAYYNFYQEPWKAFINGSVTWPNSGYDGYPAFVTPFGGYWVYMQHPDQLFGFSYTPLPWFRGESR